MVDQPEEKEIKSTSRLGRPKKVMGRDTSARKRKRGDSTGDWSFVPPDLIPEGYTVEWKNTHIYGQPVPPDYHIDLRNQGWEPASMHQFGPMMPDTWEKTTIERRGQILMIRPKELTDEARAEDRAAANEQIRGKLQQVGLAPSGTMERTKLTLKKSYESVDVPD